MLNSMVASPLKMDHISILSILAIIAIYPHQGTYCQGDASPVSPVHEDPDKIDYAKLKLNTKELHGSRWAIEQSLMKEKVTVYHQFKIVDVVKVDVGDMSVRVDFHLKQRWNASSLQLPKNLFKDNDTDGIHISVNEEVLNSVWSPDSFIPNARETKILSVTDRQSAVNIFKNKTIIYKARMYAVLGCSFLFQWYPVDKQVCSLFWESYKYTINTVNYEWEPVDPVTALPGILLYQYEFDLPPKISVGEDARWAGNYKYPYVKMTFKFERRLGNNVLQVFIPSSLIVVLSFFSFWLGLDAVPGRISLLVTCILTLVTMHGGLKGVIPPVHYVKMMDVWLIGCMIFVFGAICEFIVVKYMKWRAQQIKNSKDEYEKYMKEHGYPLQPQLSSSPQPLPPFLIENKIAPVAKIGHPEYGQHPFVQAASKHLDHETFQTNSAQKRHAWNMEQVQREVLAMQPELTHPYNVGYPPGHNPFHDNSPLMIAYPPPTKPLWVKIDRICRGLFPLLFGIFNSVYWPILIIGSEKQHVNV